MGGDTTQEIELTEGEVTDVQVMEGPVALATNPLDLPTEQFKESLDRRKANRDVMMNWIKEALVEGTDYGRIHFVKKATCSLGKDCQNPKHFAKPSLFKPGSEKILGMLGITVSWPTLAQYEQAALDGRAINDIILRCEAINSTGEIVAEGMGARSVSQDSGDLNKALKMAKKSGMIDMTLTLGGLSEIFTQDIEDMNLGDSKEPLPKGTDTKAPRKAAVKDELIELLKCPGLSLEIVDEMTAMIGKKQTATWYKKQIEIVKGLIADAEQVQDGKVLDGDNGDSPKN